MTVFKGYLKILNKNKFTVILYLTIFTVQTFVFSQDTENAIQFENIKANVLWIDHDNTELTKDLKGYLSDFATFKKVKNDNIEDAFFYREIEVIIEIPSGFTDSLKMDEPMKLKTKTIPNSSRSFAFEDELKKYLNFATFYIREDIPVAQVHEAVTQHLSQGIDVRMTQEQQGDYSTAAFYFNFLAYIFVALIVTVVGVIMYSFKTIDIKRRLHLASISMQKINLILIFGNLLLGIVLYVALMGLSYVILEDLIFTTQGLLFMLNAFLFMLNSIALAYLIASIFDSVNVIGALGTICSLGFAFVTGVFVPQQLLNDNLLKFARIIPSYWYVLSNDRISTMTQFNRTTLKPIMVNSSIIVFTALLFIVIAFVVTKLKQQSEH